MEFGYNVNKARQEIRSSCELVVDGSWLQAAKELVEPRTGIAVDARGQLPIRNLVSRCLLELRSSRGTYIVVCSSDESRSGFAAVQLPHKTRLGTVFLSQPALCIDSRQERLKYDSHVAVDQAWKVSCVPREHQWN